ncbi:MAG: TlyA family RNA methyltransferase [Ruminococcaceae bacterium]|nr:TlyA family RNA methyltransferase [Oscillospiraceae bacterium]
MRLDVYLTEMGLAKSRSKAAECIEGGFVLVNGRRVTKVSLAVGEGDTVEVTGKPYDFVSRGGVKLDGALEGFGIDVAGSTALDIGASTGGFTDCLLKRGAGRVYAVDSGKGQLDESLRGDPRVISMEGFNARELSPTSIPEPCGIIVSDLSFISQTLILPAVPAVSTEDAVLISLIKPQFECGREALNKNGIVKDKKFHTSAIKKVLSAAAVSGFVPIGLMRSSITGGDGNIEYLYYAKRGLSPTDGRRITDGEIREVVNESH